jgi:DNA repair exonuclease SbcCD ATPase subunit
MVLAVPLIQMVGICVQELTDAYFDFEEEKTRWASLEDNHAGECQGLGQEITKLHNEVLVVEKEKCESWEVNCKKLEEQIVLAKSIMKEEVDELQAQLDKVISEKKDLRLQIAELNSRLETVSTLHIIQFSQQRFQVDNINCFYCPPLHFTIF